MAVDYELTFEGVVSETLPGGIFLVQVNTEIVEEGAQPQNHPDNIITVRAVRSGKMKQGKIRLLPGDKVKVILNDTDITRGRIVYRVK